MSAHAVHTVYLYAGGESGVAVLRGGGRGGCDGGGGEAEARGIAAGRGVGEGTVMWRRGEGKGARGVIVWQGGGK